MTLMQLPCWGLPFGEIVAEHRFELIDPQGQRHSLEARLGRPIAVPAISGYCCQFQIEGFGTGKPKWSRAGDAVNAVRNALASLDAEVCIIECNLGLHQPNGNEKTGFREVPYLRETWQAWCLQADHARAVSLAVPLAESGVAFGQKVLGLAKWLGLGTEAKLDEAISWLEKAAEQGEADACDALAGLYANGHSGVPRDPELGKRYREMARYYGIEM